MLEQFYEVKTIFILTMNLWSCIADLILLSSAVSKDLSITTKEIFIRVSVLKKSNIGFFISFIQIVYSYFYIMWDGGFFKNS